MKLNNLTQEELEAMNYDDIAYLLISDAKKPLKINELFSKRQVHKYSFISLHQPLTLFKKNRYYYFFK